MSRYESPGANSLVVPFDIETTGMCSDDLITTFILHDGSYRVWLNTDGANVDKESLEETIEDRSGIQDFNLNLCDNEVELMKSVSEYTNDPERYEDGVYVTAYNGETYRGGFDLPFIRNSCLRAGGVEMPFAGQDYFDLSPIFDKGGRFNTEIPDIEKQSMKKDYLREFCAEHIPLSSRPDDLPSRSNATKDDLVSEIRNSEHTDWDVLSWAKSKFGNVKSTRQQKDQCGVHKAIVTGTTDVTPEEYDEQDFDPFDDSKKAIFKFQNEEWVDLVLHCLADVKKSKELSAMAKNYASPSDFKFRRIQPLVDGGSDLDSAFDSWK